MFKGSNVAWGIDLGHQSLKAVKISRAGGTVSLDRVEKIPYEGMEPDPDSVERTRHIRTALVAFMELAKPKKNDRIGIAIPGRSAFNRTIPLPPVEAKRIPDIVKYEAQQLIPFPIDEVIWDYQRLGEDELADELEVTLFAVKTQIIYGFLSSLKAAQIHADIIQVAPLSLYNCVQFDQKPQGSTIVVDIGAGNADLVLLDGDRFWNRPLPYSGDDITKALQERFQIDFEEAEELKLNAATSKQAEKLFNVMRPVLGDMVSEIHRSIGYYKSQTRNVKFDRMVLLGEAFKLQGMKEFFAQHLDYSVGLLDRLENITYGPGIDEGTIAEELSSYGVALGLALQAMGEGPIKINMLPREERLKKIIGKKKPFGIAAAAILGLCVGTSWLSSSRQLKQLESSTGIAKPIVSLADKDDKEYNTIKGAAGTAEGIINGIVGVGNFRDYWPLVINELQRVIPPKYLLVSLDAMETGSKSSEQAGEKGETVQGITCNVELDLEWPENVEEFQIIASVNEPGGIEFELKENPFFHNPTRISKSAMQIVVGLQRKKDPSELPKPEGETDPAATGDPAPTTGGFGPGPKRGGFGPAPRKGGFGPAPKKGGFGSASSSAEKGSQDDVEVISRKEIRVMRFKYSFVIKKPEDLNGSEEWWGAIVRMTKENVEKGDYQTAFEQFWGFYQTSSDFGNKERKDELKDQAGKQLKELYAKLKEEDQPMCKAILDRIRPGWEVEKD